MSDFEKHEKISVFNQVLNEIVGGFRLQSQLDFLTLRVALNQVSHYFVFLVHLLGMLLHIIKHAVIKHNYQENVQNPLSI